MYVYLNIVSTRNYIEYNVLIDKDLCITIIYNGVCWLLYIYILEAQIPTVYSDEEITFPKYDGNQSKELIWTDYSIHLVVPWVYLIF